jgi:hypothetical protein
LPAAAIAAILLKEEKPITGHMVIEKAMVTENAQCFMMK